MRIRSCSSLLSLTRPSRHLSPHQPVFRRSASTSKPRSQPRQHHPESRPSHFNRLIYPSPKRGPVHRHQLSQSDSGPTQTHRAQDVIARDVLQRVAKRTKANDFDFSAKDVDRSFERLLYSDADPSATVPVLKHGLEKVLSTPNRVHLLRPAASLSDTPEHIGKDQGELMHVAPDIEALPKPHEMHMDVISHFVPPSADPRLATLAKSRLHSDTRFAGSTSSLSGMLVQIWTLLNPQKDLHMDGLLSDAFDDMPKDLSTGMTLPPSVRITNKEGVWFIDADKSVAPDTPNDLLSALGHVGEKLFTSTAEEFEQFKTEAMHRDFDAWKREQQQAPQPYSYSQHGGLFMRSQIDCCFSDQPEKTFDIKTRATVSIRMDRLNHEEGGFYQLKTQQGKLESFERENYDLMRSAYLKYSMQARIGGMQGIFIGHHNTRQVFGFQYLTLEDMDRVTSGSHHEAQQMFYLCVGTLESILRQVVGRSPEFDNCSVTFRTSPSHKDLQIFREAPGQPIKMWTVTPRQLPTSSNNYRVAYDVDESATESEAQDARLRVSKRQKMFTSAFLPSIPELTEAQLSQVEAHNKIQKVERAGETPSEELVEEATAGDLPFDLAQGIVYSYPNLAHIKKLRRISHASRIAFLEGRLEADAEEASNEPEADDSSRQQHQSS